MSEHGIPRPVTGPATRPLWWWFLIHGVAVCVWGVTVFVTIVPGPAGWVVDGIAFGADLLVVGAIMLLTGRYGRGPRAGRAAFALGGGVMIAAAVACGVVGVLGGAVPLMWVIFGYLVVEGAILTIGTARHPAYRAWGVLGGAPMCIAASGILILWIFFPGYDVMDAIFGAFGLFYGITVVTAALLARQAELRTVPIG